MKRLLLPLILVFGFLFFPLAYADTHFCPMKCEGEKTYSAPGSCPVCGMALEKKLEGEGAQPLNSRDFRVDLVLQPESPKAGEKVKVSLAPRRTLDNSALELEVVHEKPLHLITVTQELDWFSHDHPVKGTDGTWQLEMVFPRAGNYIFYADFVPKGARNQVFPLAFQVQGVRPKIKALKASSAPRKVGSYTFTLIQPKALLSNEAMTLTFKIAKGGKPVTDLQPYLGEKGHLVGVSEDTLSYAHSHPMDSKSGSEVAFMAHFPRPGLYKIWGQFLHQGQILIADFVLSVKEK